MARFIYTGLLIFISAITYSQNNLSTTLPDCASAGESTYITADQINACYNPLTDAITIELKDKKTPDEQMRIELFSVLGLSVYDKTYAKPVLVEIPAKDFKKGMYVIVVSDGKNTIKKRILVN